MRSRVSRYNSLRLVSAWGLLALVLWSCGAGRLGYQEPQGSSARERMTHFFVEAGLPITTGNTMTLLPSGQAKFDDLFEHIRQARHHVHLEYFNFRNDSISALLFDLLALKAQEGVRVRALFDAFGNLSNDSPLSNRYLQELRHRGIGIYKYDPFRFPWIQNALSRDHRKIVVIDGRIGYLGGMNIADYYIEGKPKIGAWRDMHCRVEGEVVPELQKIFAMMWHKTTGEQIEGEAYFPTTQTLTEGLVPKTEGSTCEPSAPTPHLPLVIVDRHPRLSPSLLREAYAHAILSADSVVRIVNPYFVPTRYIQQAIRKAVDRGVRVEIMVSDKSDIPFTPDAMLHKLRRLARRGAQVHLYTEGFHHTKVMTIDGEVATLGSLNLNSRSLRYDSEVNVFVLDSSTTAQFDRIYQSDQRDTIPLDDVYWKRRSLWRKFVGWVANLFTPFL